MVDMGFTLTSLTLYELQELIASWGEPSYRAKQVFQGIHKGKRPDEITNIPQALARRLLELPFGGVEIERKLVSEKDGTVKYLFKLEDNNLVEGVLMHYDYGNTLCISSQVGCNMGCAFCASTLDGCVRSLTAGEMLFEVLAVEKDIGVPKNSERNITNIVMMGSGEPLDNYDNTVKFITLVNNKLGMGISQRNISVSTCGLADRIIRLIDDGLHVTLSVSLHAPNNEIRDTMMPINKAFPIERVLGAAKTYADRTGRRVIFEYALVKNVNDKRIHAEELARVLRGINCHVNLIPLNSVKERELTGVARKEAYAFCEILESLKVSATVRREMGADIDGACGQLRRRVMTEGNAG